MDSFSKQKLELEKICSEITEMQCDDDIITENFGFCFDDGLEEEVYDEFNYVLEDLKALKEEVLLQRNAMAKNLKQMECLAAISKLICHLYVLTKNQYRPAQEDF